MRDKYDQGDARRWIIAGVAELFAALIGWVVFKVASSVVSDDIVIYGIKSVADSFVTFATVGGICCLIRQLPRLSSNGL